jgi:hypothetical protein
MILIISLPICLIFSYGKEGEILYHLTHRSELIYLYVDELFVKQIIGIFGLIDDNLAAVYQLLL